MATLFEIYDLKDELGKGAFSVVKLAVNKKTNEKVAVKIIDKTQASAESDAKRLKTEVEILKKVSHPNIVCLKELYETPQNLYLVMELVTGGELFDKIVEKGQYTEKEASSTVLKILSSVDYLHNINIAHRDLKPENLLLKGDDVSDVMISDFGLSKIISQDTMMATACGTPYYVAPEVLSAQGYDKEVDLWSIGVITYLLLCGFPPFYGETLPDVFEQIMKADFNFPDPYWTNISQNAKDFISKILVVDTKKRLTAKEAMEHPWIKTLGGEGSNSLLHEDYKSKLEKHNSLRKVSGDRKSVV